MTGVARYQLTRTIASGGMAHVYEAVAKGERGFERRVAIKRVLPQLAADPSMQRMFFDEARIASHLHHSNIVQVLDYGVVDGTEFIVMEYVDGIDAGRATTLAKQQGRRMPEPLALHVVAEIAHALAYAHTRSDSKGVPLRIVHRDVSPANILLSWDGAVKLSDFGIALASQREEKTATGIVKGKLAYMAPEQAAGERVTGAADVYALGATLHALLGGPVAGGAPVDGEEISSDVRELVQACMAPVPDERPSPEAVAFRAGQLAARAFDRDARGALAEWVAPLRGATPKVSALDDLMGLALVALGDGRSFTVSRPPGGAAPAGGGLTPEARAEPGAALANGAAPAIAGAGIEQRVSRLPTTPARAARAAGTADGSEPQVGAARVAATVEANEPPARERTEPVVLPTRRNGPWLAGIAVALGVGAVVVALTASGGEPAGARPAAAPGTSASDPGASVRAPASASASSPAAPAPASSREAVLAPPPSQGGPGAARATTHVETTVAGQSPDAPRAAAGVTGRDAPGVASTVVSARDRHRPLTTGRERPPEAAPVIAQAPSPPATSRPAPTVAAERGFVRIPRGSAGQERVEIDGRESGFTPSVRELTTGSHRFVIFSASTGQVLLDRTLTLAAEHTRSAPIVVTR